MRNLFNSNDLLYSLRVDNEEINKLVDKLNELKAIATSVTVATDKEAVQSSGSQDKMANIVAKIVDLEYEIDAEVDGYIERREFVKEIIFEIENENYQNILYDYFICNLDLWQIEENENINHDNARQRMFRAQKVFEKIFNAKKNIKTQNIVCEQ